MATIALRRLVIDDVDDEYIGWHSNDDGHLNFFSGTRRKFDAEELRKAVYDAPTNRTHFFLITIDDGVRVGTIKIGPIDTVNKTSDLVCLIGNRAFVGKGLAKSAIAQANEIAFNELGVRRLHSGMFEDNVASIKAYTRAGWYIEARMRGFYWLDGRSVDRICVACLNPVFFPDVATDD